MTFLAEIDSKSLLSLCIKIAKRILLLIVAERADQSINSPLVSTKGAEEVPLPNLFS